MPPKVAPVSDPSVSDSSTSYEAEPSTGDPSEGDRPGNGSSDFLANVRAACRRSGYTYRTEQTYTRWIVRYVKYHNTRHPSNMGKEEVREYLSYLATGRQVAASTQNQALNALLFLYRDVLGRKWDEVTDFQRAWRSGSP